MKKIIALLAAVLLLSCSKDDDTMKLTYQNLAGKWNFKSFAKTDGSIVPYTGRCSTQKDYAEIFSYGKITTYNYYPNCIDSDNLGCSDYTYDANDMIYSTTTLFNEVTITHLTKSGFKMEFPEPKNLTPEFGVNDVKAIIFEKRQ